MENSCCIVLFVKYPEKGVVKTRLVPDLGEDDALGLYRCFVSDTLDNLTTGSRPVRISFYPPDRERLIGEWLGDYPSFPQRGDDLGERMMSTFLHFFSEGFSRVVILGSDIPDLPMTVIEEAFDSLGDHDAVIGPASDGGYYLLGLTREGFRPDLFRGMPWGTAAVFGLTMEVFRREGIMVHSLPEWRDVDTPDDLRALWERAHVNGFRESRTVSFLRSRRIFHGTS